MVIDRSASNNGVPPGPPPSYKDDLWEIDRWDDPDYLAWYRRQERATAAAPSPAAPPRQARANADNSDDPLDRDATVADLIEAGLSVQWKWNGWIQSGILTALASEAGVGKTRLCADLASRVWRGLPWPDGSPATFPKESRTLWVAADHQHAQLTSFAESFDIPPEALVLNATRRNPYGGTMLDALEDLTDFEARIARVKPALIFLDTATKATDRTAHKPEDAKAFFTPLMQLAQRQNVVLVCVTHLNAAGKPLGRRIEEVCRVVIMLERPDPDGQPERRKLWVKKTFGKYPVALGVSMGDRGNEYDTNPPAPSCSEPGAASGKKSKLAEVKEWLQIHLVPAAAKVYRIRREAEEKGFSVATLYRAKDALGIEEYETEGKKWWRLTTEEAVG